MAMGAPVRQLDAADACLCGPGRGIGRVRAVRVLAPRLVRIGERWIPTDGEFCEVDFQEQRRRAMALRDGWAAYGLPVPLAFTPPDLADTS